ncbi:phosphonate C-P lyase system protein PhnH [Devosia sp. CN2-171]|uniref:phosphonate C-P lyase system protein PhnH n=1 Tax=Devosia sp. CN2-171 TaxID=3400909 RepID=UPI003BF8F86C
MDTSIEGGFADVVFGAQSVFRAIMDGLARPGTVQSIVSDAAPPAPLTSELGAVALTLCDHDTPVWLDPALAASEAVRAWLAFHCGAPITEKAAEAQFALVTDASLLPQLQSFGQGTDEYPDRSTTVVLATGHATRAVTLKGPGIKDRLDSVLPLPSGEFLAQWADNRERFPRGIDLLLVRDGTLVALPRTTRISEA